MSEIISSFTPIDRVPPHIKEKAKQLILELAKTKWFSTVVPQLEDRPGHFTIADDSKKGRTWHIYEIEETLRDENIKRAALLLGMIASSYRTREIIIEYVGKDDKTYIILKVRLTDLEDMSILAYKYS